MPPHDSRLRKYGLMALALGDINPALSLPCRSVAGIAGDAAAGYNSEVTTHTLETHMYRFRQKIEKDAAAPAILVTEAGGYKLVP
jgi:hypothetical protein